MRNKINSIQDYAVLLLSAVVLMLPILSWMLSAFGVQCHSLLDDEGWRWMFLSFPESGFKHYTIVLTELLVIIGAIERSGMLLPPKSRTAVVVSGMIGIVMLAFLIVAALHPQSPLLSIWGILYHSAYLYGITSALMLCAILVSSIYGLLSQNIKSVSDLCEVICHGIVHYRKIIVLSILATYIKECIHFILG